ncbi:hypothetical protein [uncultured Clostridium sp.]|uniref:hypothetical protein n=1 Tax=uncultured Clostridium sp. TaxID=59620 RepID=UPI0025DFAC72|nr:hypothetical protein [uncultured Clostridium sp.]
MLISKIFLKDMLTNKKVKNYFLFIFIFAVFSYEIIGDFIYEVFSKSNIAFITMVVVLTSTAYLIYTYSLYEKVKNYISLPIKNSRFILGFILSLILVTFLERVSFIIIVVCVACENILINIFQVIIWKTKQELWKHPRKYVISLLVFIFTTIVGVILL